MPGVAARWSRRFAGGDSSDMCAATAKGCATNDGHVRQDAAQFIVEFSGRNRRAGCGWDQDPAYSANPFCRANRCDRIATGCQPKAGRRRGAVRVVIKSGAENTGDAVVGMLSRTVISRMQHPAELRDQQQRNEVSAKCPWASHRGKVALHRCASNIVRQYKTGFGSRSAGSLRLEWLVCTSKRDVRNHSQPCRRYS